jgi:predicted kinase
MAKEYAERFYNSKAWQTCRKSYISNRVSIDGGVCEKCHIHLGYIVHHKKYITAFNINDSNITLNHQNLEYLCHECHNKVHEVGKKKERETILHNGCYFDESGNLTPQKRIIVYGAPASGKTTYVKENMEKGDMVVDLDYIKQAISFTLKDQETNNLLPNAIQIRNSIYNLIENGDVDSKRIWIIAGLPKKTERDALAKRLKAKLLHIDVGLITCKEQAHNDFKRNMPDWIIEKYFEEFEE